MPPALQIGIRSASLSPYLEEGEKKASRKKELVWSQEFQRTYGRGVQGWGWRVLRV
jgi:hypothetical protein